MNFQKNEIITVEIEDIGSEGQGIGKADGFTLFVKDAIVGDTVEARILKVKKNYAYARLEKVLIPSPFRVEPKCRYHRQCGGCQLQTLSYEKQLEFKQKKIRDSLVRIGGFAQESVEGWMEPMVGMDEPFRYRNKAQYPVGTDRDGNVVTGFYAGHSHDIIANTDCHLGVSENEEILGCILRYMRRHHVTAYDEKTGTGLVRHILIRKGFASGEIMVCLVINKETKDLGGRDLGGKPGVCGETAGGGRSGVCGEAVVGGRSAAAREIDSGGKRRAGRIAALEPSSVRETETGRRGAADRSIVGDRPEELGEYGSGVQKTKTEWLPAQEELLQELAQIKYMTSVSVSINTQRTNVIMGTEIHTLWGQHTISDTIRVRDMTRSGYPFTGAELTFRISPLSFYQVNPGQTEKLYSLALEYAGLTGAETVWDLYCGIGTISLFLAGNAKKVYGVEIVPQAIEDARENARRNGIGNAAFSVGKAEEVLEDFYGENEEQKKPDVIVVDPPRKGCDEACLEAMLKVQPKRIVYVSCDPATLARDLRVLCDGGYEVRRVRGVDQFGMTVHVETVCLLSNRKSKPDSYVDLSINMEDYHRIKNEEK